MGGVSYILLLPSEVAEAIVLWTAIEGFPTAIASLAQTCRSFRDLIYNPSDTHLWREVFLTTFDDPRDVYFARVSEFDWSYEFQERISVDLYLKSAVEPITPDQIWEAHPRPENDDYLRTLSVLLSVLKTTLRHPGYGPGRLGNDPRAGKVIDCVRLPYEGTLSAASRFTTFFPARMLESTAESTRNIPWMTRVLENGLPGPLMAKLCGMCRDLSWDRTMEAYLLGQLITYTGFITFNVGPEEHEGVFFLDRSLDPPQRRARYRARELVYDMHYLDSSRHWGPYLPVSGGPWVVSRAIHEDILGNNASDEPGEPSLLNFDSLPPPQLLEPDWGWLGAARILVEANMKDLEIDGLHRFTSLDSWREQGWVESSTNVSTSWDWAGVEGIWRRCVCWIGYSRLIRANVYGGFDDSSLRETCISVPMRLHVVRFGPPTIPEYPERPVIVFEGESGGQDWIEDEDEGGGDARKVRGAVSMLAGGHVRWQMFVSSEESPNEDDWVSEAIQIGGVASGAGIIGMWTGAQHMDGDPLGPFWQWRVA